MNKTTIHLVITLLSMFLLPMVTSWLLDWSWISQSWPRVTLVLLLMLLEIAICVFLLREIIKNLKKPNQ